MSTYTTAKFGLRAPNGDEPLLSSDDLIRAGMDDVDAALDNQQKIYLPTGNRRSFQFAGGVTAGNYTLTDNALATGVVPFVLDPAELAISGRTTKLRVRATLQCNTVPPGITFTFGLYTISAIGGASGSAPTVTLSGVVSGSTVAIATPGADSHQSAVSADFAVPGSPTSYALGVAFSGTSAAGANVAASAQLLARHV